MLLFLVMWLTSITANVAACDHMIGQPVTKADGRTNYSRVKPGDRVCIVAGKRNALTLRNFSGTTTAPITFINSGGQVLFTGSGQAGIRIQNSQFFRLTGTGDSQFEYGMKVDGSYRDGVNVSRKSSNMEIDHIEVTKVTHQGIQASTRASCSDGSNNNYDYDGDGQKVGDLDDVVSQESFTQYNTRIHHNYVHQIGEEAFYIGRNRTVYATYGQGSSSNCPVHPKDPLNPVLDGLLVYSNLVRRTGRDSINIKGAIKDCLVYSNRIYEDSTLLLTGGQDGGIRIGLNSQCDVYNNFIKNGFGKGIVDVGNGGKIYNNVIINPGRGFPSNPKLGSGISISLGIANGDYFVWNNTIVNPSGFGIRFSRKDTLESQIQNNIIADPGAYRSHGERAYIVLRRKTQAKVSHNLAVLDIAEAKFANPALDDYSLLPESPAVDTGRDLNSAGVSVDYLGVPRPQGENYDIGAYERVR
jgi:hypothetical protein